MQSASLHKKQKIHRLCDRVRWGSIQDIRPCAALTAPDPTANIDILAAGLRILDGLARQSFDRLARSLSGPRRLAWPRTSPFHGGNTGSNPVGDAN